MAAEADRPLTIENWPPALRRRLRVLAAARDTTMRQLLIDAATAHCNRLEAIPGRTPGGGWAITDEEAAEVLRASQ